MSHFYHSNDAYSDNIIETLTASQNPSRFKELKADKKIAAHDYNKQKQLWCIGVDATIIVIFIVKILDVNELLCWKCTRTKMKRIIFIKNGYPISKNGLV